ncbi:MAG: O-antigen ligase family protein [Pseudomonadota bacterium]
MGEMVGRPARLNLERAYGPFEHPIHYGFYYSALFGMILSLRGAAIDKALRMTTIIVGVFCSLSSGPLLSLVLQLVMKVWDISTRWLKYRWKILSLLAILLYLFIDLFSNRTPFHVLVSYATLRTASAFNRIHIWNWGTASVENNPVFGIGLNEWERAPWMSSSMDNFWLLTAVRYGLPALICLALAIFTLCCQLSRASNLSNQDQAYRRGWAISVTAVIIAGCTVHFWNSLYCLFFVILGSSAWINHAHRAVPRNSVTKPNMSILPELDNPQKSIVTYTRFTDVKKRRPNNSKESLPPHHSNSRDESKRYNS